MKVIGVVGLPASGKGEFSKIAAGMNVPGIVMGDAIRREVEKRGLDPTDANLGAVASALRAERGMDAIALLCVPEIQRPATNKWSTFWGIRQRKGMSYDSPGGSLLNTVPVPVGL